MGVDGAPSVMTHLDTTASSASGVWVVLQVRVEGESEPVSLSGVTIESADGRSYAQSRSDIPTACADIQPHVAWICQVAVEMPLEAIPGAHAVIPVNGSVRGDTVAEIDLGLDAQIAESWRAREEPLTITPSGPEEQPL